MTAPTKATPDNPVDWEEYIHSFNNPADFAAAFADGSFQTKVTEYVTAQNKVMADLRAQTREQIQLTMHEMFKANDLPTGTARDRLDLADRARARQRQDGGLYNAHAPAAQMDGWTESPGQFFQTALGKAPASKENRELLNKIQDYSEKIPSEGGILVPEEWRSDILTRSLEFATVRPRALVVPMPTGKLRYPAVDMTTEVGEVYGGMVFYWIDEGEDIVPTSAQFAAISLDANKLVGGALVPSELLNDASTLNPWLLNNMPRGIGAFEDIALMKGNGVGKPLGALHETNPALITASKEVGQTGATITWTNVLSMFSRMLPESYGSAVWVITPDAIPEIFTMALPVGTGGSAVMLGEGSGSQSLPMSILGIPIIWSRRAPAVLGTKGDISLVDFSQYIIGDTQDMRLDTNVAPGFWTDKMAFRIIERLDGKPGQLSALTPENGGPTLSSFVQLETRAA